MDKEKFSSKERDNDDLAEVKHSYFDLMINWLKNCRGKKAMIYVFSWLMIPFTLFFISMIAAMFSIHVAIFFLFLGLGVFIVMTIGLFMMLLLSN